MDTTFLVSIITFVVVILSTILTYIYISAKVKSHALKARINHGSTLVVSTGTNHTDKGPGHLKQFFMQIASVFGNFAPPKSTEDISLIRKSLLNIGYRGKNAVIIFTGVRVICTLVPPASLFFFLLFTPIRVAPIHLMIFYILLALAGYYLPTLWLRHKIAKRQEKLLNGFPDAVDMLVVCVEAGMGMDAAIERVGREIEFENDVLSEELKLYNKEMRVGKTRRQALKDLAMRTGLDEMRTLSTLLIQTDKFGTSVAQALKAHSDFLRVQRYQRAEERAAKLTVKLVIPLIFCMFPSVFIVILGPAIINAIRINQ
ncbi:MAG: type II secretion system F family protein [Planctomycetota bacterium]|jgi:tight adherence protein C